MRCKMGARMSNQELIDVIKLIEKSPAGQGRAFLIVGLSRAGASEEYFVDIVSSPGVDVVKTLQAAASEAIAWSIAWSTPRPGVDSSRHEESPPEIDVIKDVREDN